MVGLWAGRFQRESSQLRGDDANVDRSKKCASFVLAIVGNGFLPSKLQGVALRAKGDPVLFLSDPPGVDKAYASKMLDGLAKLNQLQFEDM